MAEPNKNDKVPLNRKPGSPVVVYLIFLVIMGVIFTLFFRTIGSGKQWLSDAEAAKYLNSKSVTKILIDPISVGDATSGEAQFILSTSTIRPSYFVSDVDSFRKEIAEKYPEVQVLTEPLEGESIWIQIIPYLIMMVFFMFFFMMMMGRVGGGGNAQAMNFGKSRARMYSKNDRTITFKDVAGYKEEKEEMKVLVDFLSEPARYTSIGARIPKGVLLVGPPGTGKTFLARAVAGEAKVPFFTISGSDFVEMFVGVGASRVRDLFAEAKKHAPAIIFIDEIDAVGRRRGAGLGGGHDEREQTLNQLLVEMDGFTEKENIIVMAATNRVDILDPALLRPGRFDRQLVVNRPDLDSREAILNIYTKNKPMSSDVDISAIAKLTAGFTPADLENLLNEAAIQAAQERRSFISQSDLRSALIRVGVGTEKKSHRISEKEKKITAYHEMGHAIVHLVLPDLDTVHVVSIIPTGMAGGYTMSLPDEDTMYMSRNQMKAEMSALLGGRVAEALIFNDVTTGASNDLERVSSMARDMVTRYGMSETLGPIQFGEQDQEVFLGKEIGHTRNYGEAIANQIDQEVKALVLEAEKQTMDILKEYMDLLHEGAALLMEKEKVTGDQLKEMLTARMESQEPIL